MTTAEAVARVERALFERPDQSVTPDWIRCGDSTEEMFFMDAALEPDLADAFRVVLAVAREAA